MATYCIGDLHGNYEGFLKMVKKIDFDKNNDRIYILGDIFDGEPNGIKIVNWIYENQDSVFLIRGNHESFVEDSILPSICIVKEHGLENAFNALFDVYSDDLWKTFFNKVFMDYHIVGNEAALSSGMTYEEFIDRKNISEWVKVSKARKNIAFRYFELIKNINRDEQANALRTMLGAVPQYRAKSTVFELLGLNEVALEKLKVFLESLPTEYEITYAGKKFCLRHEYIMGKRIRHMFGAKNTCVIFGHTPVALLHRNLHERAFDFDYKKVFAYIDINGNRYYNLDLSASKIVAALRLDDLKEFYSYSVEENSLCRLEGNVKQTKFQEIESASFPDGRLVKRVDGNDIFLSYSDNCYEFVIAYIPEEFKIYYYRADYIDEFKLLQNYRIDIKSKYSNRENIYKIVKKHYFENGFEDNGAFWSNAERIINKRKEFDEFLPKDKR